MKFLISLMTLLATNVFAWETSNCQGTQPQRIAALKKLGAFSLQYKSTHGSFPNPMFENNTDFNAGIPKELNSYLISKNDSPESIGFICFLPTVKKSNTTINDEEWCYFNLETGETKCTTHFLEFESDPLPR